MSISWRFAPVLLVLTAACESPSAPEAPPARSRVDILPDSLHFTALRVDAQVEASVFDSTGIRVSRAELSWSVLGPPVVAINGDGNVSARENGKASIVAEAVLPDGSVAADTIPVVVRQVVAGIAVGPKRIGVYQGDTTTIPVVAYDSHRWPVKDAVYSWVSSTPTIASVGAAGTAKGVAAGVSTFTVTTNTFAGKATVSASLEVGVTAGASFTQVRSGAAQSCGLTRSGDVYCWGESSGQMLSDGTRILGAVPVRVEGGEKFVSIDAGYTHNCGLTATGVAFCWGGNLFGQLGNGDGGTEASRRDSPQRVAVGVSFTKIATGVTHSCAIASTGEAYCWGSNDFGELGSAPGMVGTMNRQPTPVAGGIRFVALSAGNRHTCGVSDQGATYCWGSNMSLKLGTSAAPFSGSAVPVRVEGAHVFSALYASGDHTCGVTPANEVYCWGGWIDITPTNVRSRATPTRVGAGIDFASVAEGNDSMCGVARDGAAYCWKAGDESPVVRVPGTRSFTSMSPGRDRSCAIAVDEKIYCWGPGGVGGMGDGKTLSTTSPVPVSAPL